MIAIDAFVDFAIFLQKKRPKKKNPCLRTRDVYARGGCEEESPV